MTENEAKAVRFIENIKNHAMVTLDHIVKEEPNVSPLVYKGREERANTILAMVEELKQYREIGTPEECRAAMEKQPVFNMDKVVEQLEKEFKKYYGKNWNKVPYLVKVIEIVQGSEARDVVTR